MFWFIVAIMALINILTIPWSDQEIKYKKKVLINDMYNKHHGK